MLYEVITNTAISAIMELFNAMSDLDGTQSHPQQAGVMRFALESLALLISVITSYSIHYTKLYENLVCNFNC